MQVGRQACVDVWTMAQNLQSLKLNGKLGELPHWIGKLHNLVKLRLERTKLQDPSAAIKVLGVLPSLAILLLWEYSFDSVEAGIRLNFRLEDAMLPSLRMLLVFSIDDLKSVKFEKGAMPKPELLHFVVSSTSSAGFFSGLELLPSLKEFMLAGRYKDDFLEDLQNQLYTALPC
ncbi:hypothetical protein E2562_026237 [Oryza meyeriana var. granulata]|uniref:Disease resistance R13L4/SHOC-2-like LRR domain-containing protein n=1 Tax=Oryza meyeriana var. granulata TaxID=110450 RepID=A0A6G1CH90_9ORYZ|nr:hypothetical protein E2562_026237 [Oryza meyeriana var. granulata]